MKISHKITPELKKAFIESIDKTKKTGREHGFYICKENEKLYPSKQKCEGSICGIVHVITPTTCPGKIQGMFHAHPHKPLLELLLQRKISEEEIQYRLKDGGKILSKLGTTIQTPSHKDVLGSFLFKCDGYTEGTICTGSDLETDKVECWTPKDNAANFLTCNYAKLDNAITRDIGNAPKKWVRHLFERESINLRD